MTEERWLELMSDDCQEPLTPDELLEGWHFCPDCDGLLINPTMAEYQHCTCESEWTERLASALEQGAKLHEGNANPS